MSNSMRFPAAFALHRLHSCAQRSSRAVRSSPASLIERGAMLGLVLSCIGAVPLLAQEVLHPSKNPEREAWRKAMVKIPLPKNGCFQASYPNKEWQEVPCSKAPLLTSGSSSWPDSSLSSSFLRSVGCLALPARASRSLPFRPRPSSPRSLPSISCTYEACTSEVRRNLVT